MGKEYYAYFCDACKRHSMSTTKKNPYCKFCNSRKVDMRYMGDNSKLVSEFIRRSNIPDSLKKGNSNYS
jgi:hypothetical protein